MSNVFTASVNNQKQFILPVTNLLPNGGLGLALANSNTIQNWGSIVIPQQIKDFGFDYISFSSLSSSTTGDTSVCVVNINYTLPAVMDSKLITLPNQTEIDIIYGQYRVEIRPVNGELLPIDLRSIYSISLPKTGYSSYSTVTNITLWKSFFTSDANNSLTFLKDNLLFAGTNTDQPPPQ